MAQSTKTLSEEGDASTNSNNNDDGRVSISGPQPSSLTFNFRPRDATTAKISTAFSIAHSTPFFLVDAQDNIEFPDDKGVFDVTPSTKYRVLLSDASATNEQDDQKKDGNANEVSFDNQKVKLSVVGNQDGRSTAVGYYLTAHGSMDKDKRDQASFYVIGHADTSKVGIWKLHPFRHDTVSNLYRIQLVTVSDGRGQGRNRWLAVHGSVQKDKRDGGSVYVMITAETQKATIWEIVACENKKEDAYYVQVYGNTDGRKVAIGYKLAVHASNQKDIRDGASFMVHARQNDGKATQWKICLHQ